MILLDYGLVFQLMVAIKLKVHISKFWIYFLVPHPLANTNRIRLCRTKHQAN